MLEMVTATDSKLNSIKNNLFVSYKLGIVNNANKLVDFAQDQDDFGAKTSRKSKAKYFIRSRLMNEAETILRNDCMTFKVEVVYSETMIAAMIPSTGSEI